MPLKIHHFWLPLLPFVNVTKYTIGFEMCDDQYGNPLLKPFTNSLALLASSSEQTGEC